MVIYIAVEIGKLELPLYVGTRNEIAQWANLTPENISAYCQQKRESLKNNCRFEKIKIENDEVH